MPLNLMSARARRVPERAAFELKDFLAGIYHVRMAGQRQARRRGRGGREGREGRERRERGRQSHFSAKIAVFFC